MKRLLSSCCVAVMMLVTYVAPGHGDGDTSTDGLKILVYGATGKIGRHVVDEALKRGHKVTAVSRDPSRITRVNDSLSAVQGDILDPYSIASLVTGQDVVIISVRGVVGKSKDPNDAIQRIAVENVVEALREFEGDAPRLIHVGGAGSLEVEPGVLYADRLPKVFMRKKLEMEIAGQVLALEYLRGVTDVDWSYATPPKNLTNGKRTGVFRIGADQVLVDSLGRNRVSRADFAVALVDEAENAKHLQKRFSIAY